jgi:prophage regulatory protein
MTLDPTLNARFSTVREILQGVGGLASQADLARRWGVSRQRVHLLTRDPGFPGPAARVSGRSVWIAAGADLWLEHRRRSLAEARREAWLSSPESDSACGW